MTIIHQVLVETLHLVERGLGPRNLGGTQTPTQRQLATDTTSPTSSAASPTMTGSSGGSGGTSSPLLFFVALGFGVVFTNLWIIVGVKYCFRYNARNRAIRNGEDPDPINLENMPRPHRRRREKKLMTMDEVNERFPLTKYKAWVASRASEGLPVEGGITAPASRAVSLRNADGAMPSSPVDTKHSVGTRPATANSEDATPTPVEHIEVRKSVDATIGEAEKGVMSPVVEDQNKLEHVRTTSSTVDKHPTNTSELDDDDDDDHIHTAVPPELLTNPGDSCAICIDTLEEDDDIRGLTCGHAFHASCLDPWLTSRRACCPLCKADYYVPKPRPEGEAAETDRTGRRRGERGPTMPASAWTGVRGHRGIMIPGRFISGYQSNGGPDYGRQSRQQRNARRAAAASAPSDAQATDATNAPAQEPASSRWRPRISNPFSTMHMPSFARRSNRAGTNVAETSSEAQAVTPSQLEAGSNTNQLGVTVRV